MRDNDFTKILGWPGYRVYQHEINEAAKTLRLWVRRKRGNRKLICSGCGRKLSDAHDCNEREVRDLPWGEYRTTVIIEVYRVCCPQCGVRVEKVPQLPSKAPFSKRFEEAVGLACESASVRQVARHLSKVISPFELVLNSRQSYQTLTNWPYRELSSAILDGRLSAGTRLPGSRDLAAQYGISRGTVVNVFERLQAEGYVPGRVGRGTRVNEGIRATGSFLGKSCKPARLYSACGLGARAA
jgi:hypothetical protein